LIKCIQIYCLYHTTRKIFPLLLAVHRNKSPFSLVKSQLLVVQWPTMTNRFRWKRLPVPSSPTGVLPAASKLWPS
jgi:hypothetical protein